MTEPAARPVPVTPAPEPAPAPAGPTPPWRRVLRPPSARELREALRRNPGLKLFSLLLAFFLWFSINVSEPDAERMVDLPVVVRKLPGTLIVTSAPKPVTVTLRGPRTIVEGVDGHRTRVALRLPNATRGEFRVELNGGMVWPELPQRVSIVRFDPPRLQLSIDRLVTRTLPVAADLAGTPALGYTVAESHLTPAVVEVTGPEGKVGSLKEVDTEPIDLRGLTQSIQRYVLLSWAGDFVSFDPDHVTATVTVEEVMVSREFKGVNVRVRHAAENATARLAPARVDLTVRGPQRLLHNYTIPSGAVYVDAAALAPGRHRVAVTAELPEPLEVTQQRPAVQTLEITPGGS
jgi:YbbR domain-containing protein